MSLDSSILNKRVSIGQKHLCAKIEGDELNITEDDGGRRESHEDDL